MDTLQPFRDLQLSDPEGFAVAAIVVTRILQHDDEVANIRGESDAPRVDTGAMVFAPIPTSLQAVESRKRFLAKLVDVVTRDVQHVERGPRKTFQAPLDAACDFLREQLADGPKPAVEVLTEAQKQHYKLRTITRARKEIGVQVKREGFGPAGTYFWLM